MSTYCHLLGWRDRLVHSTEPVQVACAVCGQHPGREPCPSQEAPLSLRADWQQVLVQARPGQGGLHRGRPFPQVCCSLRHSQHSRFLSIRKIHPPPDCPRPLRHSSHAELCGPGRARPPGVVFCPVEEGGVEEVGGRVSQFRASATTRPTSRRGLCFQLSPT